MPALLPFVVREFDLSYLAAGAVMLVWSTASSVIQPLFGLVSDRLGAIWLLPGGRRAGGRRHRARGARALVPALPGS